MSAALAGALVVLLLAGPAAARGAEGDDLARWRDPRNLERHLREACDAVEEACNGRYTKRPGILVSTQKEVEELLRTREGGDRGLLERAPDGARRFVAYYDPIGMHIHLLPQELERLSQALGAPELLHEDVLRTILVHEATHALDFQRFPVRWTLACCARSDERLAIEAVLEGHAQLVTQAVAKTWGIESAFDRLTRLYTGAYAPGEDASEARAYDQDAAFTYIQGHEFMQTLLDREGREGLEKALRDPPCETRVIERPALWLTPERRAEEPDLQAILEVFRPLVSRRAWEVSKWRLLGSAEAALSDPAARADARLTGFIDNHGLYAGSPDGNRYLNVFMVSWGSAEEAGRFVSALRSVDETRDRDPSWRAATRTDGAGHDGSLPGFTSSRRAFGGTASTELTLHVAREGRHVIELSAFGIDAREREAQARALDLAVRLLRVPPSTASAVHLRYQVRAFLEARAAGDFRGAGMLMRALLPTQADLRRAVRRPYARSFAVGYRGYQLELRTTPVSNAIIRASFAEADERAKVLAWAATTEELARGGGRAPRFPQAMRTFAREIAAPGVVWVLLELIPAAGSAPVEYVAFARLGDRFLWIRDPWTVPVVDERAIDGDGLPAPGVSAAPFPPPLSGSR